MKHTIYKLKEYLYLKEYNTFINNYRFSHVQYSSDGGLLFTNMYSVVKLM